MTAMEGAFRLAAKSSDDGELVLKEKGQTLSHLQTLHITASRSSQEEDRAGGRGGLWAIEQEQDRIGQKKLS